VRLGAQEPQDSVTRSRYCSEVLRCIVCWKCAGICNRLLHQPLGKLYRMA
jgi:formate hydrogenlyase subunit 6/NADH:ubiquinone oxidoreductase subunit I